MRYGYLFTRLAEMLPVLLIVVVATFFLAHAVPIDVEDGFFDAAEAGDGVGFTLLYGFEHQ